MVIPGHNLGNSQVSVNRTIGPTLVRFFVHRGSTEYFLKYQVFSGVRLVPQSIVLALQSSSFG